jgi:triacylglycerol lipase
MNNNISLKYPLVFVHGIVAHDRFKYFSFWGNIPKILEKYGIKIFFGNTDSFGDCDSNAKILKENIEKIFSETKAEKVNIIAHSKGGIDSRYLIWKYDYGNKIASLTTISTPHHGSELADLIYKLPIFHFGIAKMALRIFGKLYGDINPDIFNVNYQLTTKKMKEFNENIPMNSQVYYQSLYTTMRNSFDDLMFFYSHLYLKIKIGENDGVVCEYSSKWGNNIKKIEGGISHAEIVGYKNKKISGVSIHDIYINIINDLNKKGF